MDLVQSAVVSRITGAWGLENDINQLRSTTLPKVNSLMEIAEWWRFKYPYINDLLKQLRCATYDAEDAIATFDYHQLKQRIEGQNKHPIWSSASSIFKNLVTNHASTINDVQTNIDSIIGQLEYQIRLLGLNDAIPNGPKQYGRPVQQETSSILPEVVLGCDDDVEKMVKLLMQHSDGVGSSTETSSSDLERSIKRMKTGNFSILPIVGMGGMGKTTLAQLIYNDERVKNHFDSKIWVSVSAYFDLKKITTEMIESGSGESRKYEKQIRLGENISNLDFLQRTLKEKVASRRYLIVLDDVWNDNTRDWECLFNPLRSGLQGSMVLITTRMSEVAEKVGTLDPFEIKSLPPEIYWDLFKRCAFGSFNSSSLPAFEAIGKKIAARLEGCPLAAKTLGGILSANMDIEKWRNIMNSELWQIKQVEGDILPALRVSYQYLPLHLKRCFQILSLFPKQYDIYRDILSQLWVS